MALAKIPATPNHKNRLIRNGIEAPIFLKPPRRRLRFSMPRRRVIIVFSLSRVRPMPNTFGGTEIGLTSDSHGAVPREVRLVKPRHRPIATIEDFGPRTSDFGQWQ